MQRRFDNLVEMQQASCEKFKDREIYGTKTTNGYEWITYSQFAELVDCFRGGLASLGVSRGDKIGIISANRVEWAVAAYATYGLCAHFVPMYESQMLKEWEYILEDSETKVLITPNENIYQKIQNLPKKIKT